MLRILQLAAVYAATSFLISCGNSSGEAAVQHADQIKKQVQAGSPGTIPTSGAGYTMTAKLDGKAWTATHMMPDEDQRSNHIRIAGEDADGNSISFQLYKRSLKVGGKTVLSADHAADVNVKDYSGFLSAKTGEVEITKLDDKWMEGSFFMTATSSQSDKKVEITEGKFRVGLVPGLR